MATRDLLLLRHGIAEERPPWPPQDPEQARCLDAARRLTERGRQRSRQVLTRLVAIGLAGDHLFSSPLERALETASLAVEAGLAPALETAPELAPGGDPLPLLNGPARRLVLVGHEPDLSALACRLIGAPEGQLVLRKAGAILIRLEPAAAADGEDPDPGIAHPAGPVGRLRMLLSPRSLGV